MEKIPLKWGTGKYTDEILKTRSTHRRLKGRRSSLTTDSFSHVDLIMSNWPFLMIEAMEGAAIVSWNTYINPRRK